MLKTQIQELEPNKVALTIEVAKEKVNEAYDNFYRRAARSIKIPGFRLGKAPKSVIARFIGPESVRDQVEEELIKEVYPQAIKETSLRPVSNFHVEDSNLQEGQPFTFKAVFEVYPKLGDFKYTDFTSRIQREEITDESVEKVLKQLQDQYSKIQPLEDGELQIADYFVANVEVSCNGEVDKELSDDNLSQRLVENNKIFGKCKGMKVGETREFDIKIDSEEEADSKYFGKVLHYKVTLKRISRPILPELNDEFAKSISEEFSTLDALKSKIREDLEKHAQLDAEERACDDIIDQILQNYDFDVPEAMIQNTIDYFIQSLDYRWRQYGTSFQDYLRNSGKDVNEFRESFRDKAIHQTKLMLLIDAIGDKEKIEITDSEYREEIEKRAKEYNMPVEKLLSLVANSEKENNIRFALRRQKVCDFLLKNNQVNYDIVKEPELNKGGTDA